MFVRRFQYLVLAHSLPLLAVACATADWEADRPPGNRVDTGTGDDSDSATNTEIETDGGDSGAVENPHPDAGADAGADADTDTDADSDTDVDSDTDSDTDTDSDADSDSDTDSDSDSDSDADSDSDTDSDTDSDSDSDTDICSPSQVAGACVDGAESRAGCGGARTIGRTTAATATGYQISDDLCSASNEFNSSVTSCFDAMGDHTYRIYMRAGDLFDAQLSTNNKCGGGSWSCTLKIYSTAQTSGCGSLSCGGDSDHIYCDSNDSSPQIFWWAAPADGWYFIVVDGSSSIDDDEGDYDLTVKLDCAQPGCECS